MTSLNEPLAGVSAVDLSPPELSTRWQRFEVWLGRQSDRLNPILVKEARQSLRSRQFTTTFFLMLVAGWSWSILGLAMLGPSAYYNATGPTMFFVYYLILAAPLTIMIPYYAYQSLSSERHDRTYELVSITALDASGILFGKLSGIGLQMLVYLSALFPCLAFTYLLRGLDIFSVLLIVLYTCLISAGLAMLGLLLATLTGSRGRQMVAGIALAIFLFYTFGMTVTVMMGLLNTEQLLLDSPEFWQANVSAALFYGNLFVIVFLAARAQLTSVAQNRSTAMRVALVVAQLSAIAWFAWAVLTWDEDMVYGLIFCSAVAWYCCGVFIVGESGYLSPRVRRGLPRSVFGRVFLTWLTPGGGTGYTFVLANMLMLSIVSTLIGTPAFLGINPIKAQSVSQWMNGNQPFLIAQAGIIATCYVAIYLGLTRLILKALRRFEETRLMLRFLVGIVLVLFGAGVPWVIQLTNPLTRDSDYTLMQVTNPMWTLLECCAGPGLPGGTAGYLLTVLPLVAVIIWGFNLPSIAREVMQTHEITPPRVREENAALAAATTAIEGPQSPWDE